MKCQGHSFRCDLKQVSPACRVPRPSHDAACEEPPPFLVVGPISSPASSWHRFSTIPISRVRRARVRHRRRRIRELPVGNNFAGMRRRSQRAFVSAEKNPGAAR